MVYIHFMTLFFVDLSVSAMNLSWVTKETKQFTRNLLGEGRLGNSYRAMPPGGGNLVVVKVLRSGANNDPNMIRRLCECKQLNLAKVIGYLLGSHRKVLIISECVQGPSLHSILVSVTAFNVTLLQPLSCY